MSAHVVATSQMRGITSSDGRGLATFWIVAMFSNIAVYLGTVVYPIVPASLWLIVLLAWSGLTVIQQFAANSLRGPAEFPIALLLYACLCIAWYVGQGGGDFVVLWQRVMGLVICGAAFVAFSASDSALHAARRAAMWVVLVSVAVNAWDITHPFSLVPSANSFASVGRAAGFYLNPNQSGAALVLGFLLSWSVVPQRWRTAFVVAVAVGVALTLSRAAILGFVLSCIAMCFFVRSLSWSDAARAAIILSVLAWLAWTLLAFELQQRFNVDPAAAIDRLLWVLDPVGRADYSQEERLQLLSRGWQQFLNSPWVGNGLGSTELWDSRSSTHNMYVMLASDFGVVGLFVLPGIVLTAIGRIRGRVVEPQIAGYFLIFWGLFNHSVLVEFDLLLALALIAAINARELAETSNCGQSRTT